MEDEHGIEDPHIYTAWKKDITHRLKQLTIFHEKIPTVLKRCPKCKNLTLEFEPASARLFCSRCGFQEYLNMHIPTPIKTEVKH